MSCCEDRQDLCKGHTSGMSLVSKSASSMGFKRPCAASESCYQKPYPHILLQIPIRASKRMDGSVFSMLLCLIRKASGKYSVNALRTYRKLVDDHKQLCAQIPIDLGLRPCQSRATMATRSLAGRVALQRAVMQGGLEAVWVIILGWSVWGRW